LLERPFLHRNVFIQADNEAVHLIQYGLSNALHLGALVVLILFLSSSLNRHKISYVFHQSVDFLIILLLSYFSYSLIIFSQMNFSLVLGRHIQVQRYQFIHL